MKFEYENGGHAYDEGLLPLLHDPIADLFDDWYRSTWSKQKNSQYNLLKQIPGISWNIAIYEGNRSNESYLDRYDMDWSDVKSPNKLPGNASVGSGYARALNYVSSNLHKLYR